MKGKKWIVFALLSSGILACKKQVEELFRGFETPSNFSAPLYDFYNNQVTKAGFELGKKLFYDPRLSRNNTISCGSCHIQSSAFTQHGHDVSHGIDDRLGSRNSPPIMNLAWSDSFMWDGGIFNLDLFSISPITNPVEMDETMPNVLRKLNEDPEYPALFKKAFGSTDINSASFLKALSQFMVTVISKDSKYDQVQRGERAIFTADENAGYALFQQHCSGCHKEPQFTDHSFRDNGLGAGPNNDEGRKLISLKQEDQYKFKVPSLRNLNYTKPYMHDGRFRTLDAVLEHYTMNIRNTENLDPALKKNGRLGIDLTATEKQQLLSFLETLNDPTFITNPLFAEE